MVKLKNDLTDSELMKAWDIESLKMRLIRCIIEDKVSDLSIFESVERLRKQCLNPPDELNERLEAINELIDGFGIESSSIEGYWHSQYWQNTVCLYINTGDSYALTFIYNVVDDCFEITTWGDWIEAMENQLIDDGSIDRPNSDCD
jgi:hypothetical protein